MSKIPREILNKVNGREPRFEDLYTYPAFVTNLVAGSTDVFSLQIEADAYFVISQISYMSDIAGSPQTDSSRVIPLVKCLITDTGSGRNLMANSVDISAIAGHQGLPFFTPVVRWVQPNSTLNIQFTNYSGGTDYSNVSLYFHGKKLWF